MESPYPPGSACRTAISLVLRESQLTGADSTQPPRTSINIILMLDTLRRFLALEVSVGRLIEVAVWAALPYLIAGAVVVGARAGELQHQQTLHGDRDQLMSFGVLVAGWPAVLFADVCME
jgi:hypothetical protein